jgi:SpoVK/Ycf46/Vps4 family AAA+-type ATPase
MKIALSEGDSPAGVDDLCKSMAKLCIGFSGADLASLCKAAAVRCLQNGEEKTGVTKQHFLDAYKNDVVRSSNDTLVKRISSWAVF